MKIQLRALAGALAAAVLLITGASAAPPSHQELTAQAAVLMDAATGQVLYDKNMSRQRMYPASVTKIMTGLLAVENADPSEVFTASATAVAIPYNTSHIALQDGERITVDNALYALMLPSANDAANVLAEGIAGSQEAFAQMMNARAAEIGAADTHFANAHGLHDPNHYTTAYDIALITREAAKNQDFMRYFGTGRHTMGATNLQSEQRYFTNQQYMLLPDMWVYTPEVLGGKVGYTEEARHTMSTVAQKDGRTLIAVVLSCGRDDKFYDTQLLLDYGFDQFASFVIPRESVEDEVIPYLDAGGEQIGSVQLYLEEDVTIQLPRGASTGDVEIRYAFPGQFTWGDEIACSIRLEYVGAPVSDMPAHIADIPLDVNVTLYDDGMLRVERQGGSLDWLFTLCKILVGVALGTVAVLLLWWLMRRYKAMRRRKRERQRHLRRMRKRAEQRASQPVNRY